jgi:hypothetical protein
VIPLTDPQMRQRSIKAQAMAGRQLPPSVRAFRDHLLARNADVEPAGALGSKAPPSRGKRMWGRPRADA